MPWLTCALILFVFTSFNFTSSESIFRLKICILRLKTWECASPMSHTTCGERLRPTRGLEEVVASRVALPGGKMHPWQGCTSLNLPTPLFVSVVMAANSGGSCIPPSPQAAGWRTGAEAANPFLLLPAVGGKKADPKDHRHCSLQRGGSFHILKLIWAYWAHNSKMLHKSWYWWAWLLGSLGVRVGERLQPASNQRQGYGMVGNSQEWGASL